MRDFKKATPPYTYERNDYDWVHVLAGFQKRVILRVNADCPKVA
jgi:hypothetical protein